MTDQYNTGFFKAVENLWAETTGDPEINIAVLDGPVDINHPCFKGANLTSIATLVSEDASPGGVASAHGTHITSIIFGQPGSQVRGIAPSCHGLILPIFSDGTEEMPISCSQTDLARAITAAAQAGAHIINISGGQIMPSGTAETFLSDAAKYCEENKILIVAAAGNDGCDCLHVPAAFPSVLTAGAMDREGHPLESSNWGADYRSKGILAPGEQIIGASLDGAVTKRTGTSFAAPLVSGLAGLLLSLQRKQGKTPDPLAVRDIILDTGITCSQADSKDCDRFLRGIINVEAAHRGLSELQATKRRKDMSELNLGMKEGIPDLKGVEAEGMDSPPIRSQEESLENPPLEIPPPLISENPSPPPVCGLSQVTPSDMSPGTLVYALGLLGYDFGNDARRDFFAKEMNPSKEPCTGQPGDAVPEDPNAMLAYLDNNEESAEDLIWTLNMDGSPVYAIQPSGAFAAPVFKKLRAFLKYQITYQVNNKPAPEYTRVAVPGTLSEKVKLRSGLEVPVITPAQRGLKQLPGKDETQSKMMFRLFYELRNLGVTPQDRAKNAMNVYEIGNIMARMQKESQNQDIESVRVEKSPVCRPNSDCWDVVLTTFNPLKLLDEAKIAYRVTMDVVDAIPVEIGELQQWATY